MEMTKLSSRRDEEYLSSEKCRNLVKEDVEGLGIHYSLKEKKLNEELNEQWH